MPLPARVARELADLLRAALLWLGLLPAVSPVDTVVTALPAVADAPGWLSLVTAAVAVGWLNYASPDVSTLRVWAFGFLTSLSVTVSSIVVVGFSTLGSAAGGSWPLAAAYLVCWLCSLGFALILTSRRAREQMVARVDPAARGRSD